MNTMGCVEVYENWHCEKQAKKIIHIAETIDKEPLVPHRFEQAGIGRFKKMVGILDLID